MSTRTAVYGVKASDDRRRKMKAVYDACVAAGCEIPEAVLRYLEHNQSDEGEVRDLTKEACVREYSREGCDGYEVILKDLPPGFAIIRFVIF